MFANVNLVGSTRTVGTVPAVLTLLLAAQETEHVKPLDGRSLAITLAVIALVMRLVIVAGFGYFSPSDDGD